MQRLVTAEPCSVLLIHFFSCTTFVFPSINNSFVFLYLPGFLTLDHFCFRLANELKYPSRYDDQTHQIIYHIFFFSTGHSFPVAFHIPVRVQGDFSPGLPVILVHFLPIIPSAFLLDLTSHMTCFSLS